MDFTDVFYEKSGKRKGDKKKIKGILDNMCRITERY